MGVRGGFHSFSLGMSFRNDSTTVKLLNTSNDKGDVALHYVTKVRAPSGKEVIVGKGAIFSSRGKVGLGPRGQQVKCLFRGCTLFPAVAIRRGVHYNCHKRGSSTERGITSLVQQCRLRKLRGHLPSRLSNKRRREITLTEVVVKRPRTVLLSRPFSTLSNCLGSILRQRVRSFLGSCPKSVVLIARDESRTCGFYERLSVMRRNEVLIAKRAGRLFREPKLLRTTGLANYGGFSETRELKPRRVCTTS